jgi:hypothetical protein
MYDFADMESKRTDFFIQKDNIAICQMWK